MKKLALLSVLSTIAFSDIKVMVSEKSAISSINKSDLIKLYLKEIDTINGIKVVPVDNRDSYKEFYSKVLKKTPKQLRAYWAKEIYKGDKQPPKKLSSSQIKNSIKRGSNIISYASSKLTGKVVLTISR